MLNNQMEAPIRMRSKKMLPMTALPVLVNKKARDWGTCRWT